MYYKKRETVNVAFFAIFSANCRYLQKVLYRPFLKAFCMRLILFYQRRLSYHQCKFRPTCSQYTLECINNHGALLGILMGKSMRARVHAAMQNLSGQMRPQVRPIGLLRVMVCTASFHAFARAKAINSLGLQLTGHAFMQG